MTPLVWGMLGLLVFFTVVTVGSLYLHYKSQEHHGKK
ncbi:putative membrane protein [Vibrio cholerae]|nr:putative membrane protein [Vibrio cholerae]